MRNKDAQQDIYVTHSFTNYLHAGYQGRFTFFNILDRLDYTALDRSQIAKSRDSLTKIVGWNNILYQGNCLFSATWDTPKTFEAQGAMRMLYELKSELLDLAKKLSDIVAPSDISQEEEAVKYLIAAQGRFTYAKEHYVRGFVELGKKTDNDETVQQYSALLPVCTEDIKLAHEFLSSFQQDKGRSNSDFYPALRYHSLKLPGIFRSQGHDISILASRFQPGGLTYASAGIEPEHAKLWQEYGVNPAIAGYWEAHAIDPQEAHSWSESGVGDAETAGAWRLHGFNAALAAEWIAKGFPPLIALGWAGSGFTADQALEKIREDEKLDRLSHKVHEKDEQNTE